MFLPTLICAQVIAPTASTVLDKDAVHEIRLTFKQADWYQQLTTDYDTNPDDTPYREASIVWGTSKFDTIGVRFKGNSSYRGATTRKKPFRIKLNEFVKGQKIEGMASFGLSNGWSDPSFVREKPYYEMAAGLGLPAPRSNFAALYINDEYWGLYILGEIVNGDFLGHHFAKGDDGGNLYKASDPGANLAYLGTDPTAYQGVFSKESNEDADDWTDLIELARVFDQTPVAELKAKLDTLIDVDSFLTALALDNATVNLDSYVGMAQNYFLYRRPSDQKWTWIPWDPSLAFGALAQGLSLQQMKDLSLEWVQTGNTGGGQGGGFGGTATGRPIATKLWQVPEYKARYREIYRSLVDKQMVPATLVARMNALRDMIRPFVEKDTQKLVTQTQFDNAMTSDATAGGGGTGPGGAGGGGLGGAPGLQPFIEARVASIKALLDGQTPVTVSATPTSLYFGQTAGGSGAGAQTVALALSDTTKAATYTATPSASWITVAAASGPFPASLRVSTSAAGLTAGTYNGTVAVAVTGAATTTVSIPVTMTVAASPAITSNPVSLTLTAAGGGGGFPGGAGLTQTIAVASTAGASPFTVTATYTACTNFFSVTPTSGNTPATLTVSVNTQAATGQCSGQIVIASAGLTSATIPVSLTTAGVGPGGGVFQAPTITSITNSGSYASGAVAPGEIITIFGTNLGPTNLVTGAFTGGTLATAVGGIQVLFDGTAAPILYVRSNQLGVIVPFEVAGKTQTAIQVVLTGQQGGQAPPAGLQSPVVQQAVSPTAPGLFTTAASGTGQGAILNQNNAVNAAGNPAARGSVVSIYLTGAGVLTPSGRSGALGTASQTIAAPVTVTIGGQAATVSYAGAAPDSVLGLYQLNVTVPAGASAGSVPVQVNIGGAPAQDGVTMYVN